MGKTRAIKIEVHPMSLRSIMPIVSKDMGEKRQLVKDLTRVGCKDLLVHFGV